MNFEEPTDIEPLPQRHSLWPYWVVIPLFAVGYTVFCFWFMLEAWGRRDEPKPAWFDPAFVVAFPGMFFPIVGPLLIGIGIGFLTVWLPRRLLAP